MRPREAGNPPISDAREPWLGDEVERVSLWVSYLVVSPPRPVRWPFDYLSTAADGASELAVNVVNRHNNPVRYSTHILGAFDAMSTGTGEKEGRVIEAYMRPDKRSVQCRVRVFLDEPECRNQDIWLLVGPDTQAKERSWGANHPQDA
jgi:hypothetical protein